MSHWNTKKVGKPGKGQGRDQGMLQSNKELVTDLSPGQLEPAQLKLTDTENCFMKHSLQVSQLPFGRVEILISEGVKAQKNKVTFLSLFSFLG